MNACTLLSNFTREEYKGGSEPGLVLGGGWHLLFFAIEQDDGTRNHFSAPGQQGLPPTHLLPGQELHLLIRGPPPLSPPSPLPSYLPDTPSIRDTTTSSSTSSGQSSRGVTGLLNYIWCGFTCFFLSSDTSLFLMIYIHLYELDNIAKTCIW